MWPMHQQSLMLLHPMVKEKMHLQENTLFDLLRSHKIMPSTLDIMWPMHQQSLILLHPTIKEKMHLQEKHYLPYFTYTRNVAQCPLHHVTYAPTEFEVTMSRALGGEAFIRKLNIWPLTLTLVSRSHKMLPSTIYIMWPIPLQSFKLLHLTV